jgi:hypothetical protein
MALVKCRECGGAVSGTAKACPHCGSPVPKKTSVLAWIAAGAFAIFFWNVITSSTTEKVIDPKVERLSIARGACLLAVKQSLNDPGSADFELTSSWYTEDRGDTILVQPVARAKNAFGAYMKGTWNCVARPEGSNVRVLSLTQIQP